MEPSGQVDRLTEEERLLWNAPCEFHGEEYWRELCRRAVQIRRRRMDDAPNPPHPAEHH